MAETTILNPNDQPTGRWRLINELRECLRSDEFDTFLLAVAFAKTGPLLRLHAEIDHWLAEGKKIEGIFGVNHKNTSKQALELALEKFTEARILFHSDDFTYHPKMYLFTGPRCCRFFIGSHNLTVGGTETNWESGLKLSLKRPEDEATFTEAMNAWNAMLGLSVQVTQAVIQNFEASGKLCDETARQRRPAAYRPPPGAPSPFPAIPRMSLKIKPASPIPAQIFTRRRGAAPPHAPPAHVPARQRPVAAETLVIQIVPHHNGEVFLSKMAVNQNPDFFGFPFTGRTTPKKSSNPSYPQRVPDPIVDLKVHGPGASPVVRLPRLALNTVFYQTKSEIRITVPPDVVHGTPPYSILVMRQAPDESECDYEMDIFPPDHPQFREYLAVCNQTLPSGGKATPRQMGWL